MEQLADKGDVSVKKNGADPSIGRWRIVIVDDNRVLRSAARSLLLTEPGLEVVGEGENGAEGVKQVLELRPDAVVIDISMPVMDGVEATRRIKAEAPDSVVIGFSLAGLEERNRLLDAGAAGVVQKSDPANVLIAAVLNALAARGSAVADA